ncbi:MAG: glycosyltransferase family 2 protein [Gracilimonas sp.]|nr:glycosyltransferase family 2 protein [Gracilimonas sp.]
MENKPTVTIGIPVLNEGQHIERVVRGFLASDYSNLVEILIADGGSTDNTRELVAELSVKDNRVKLIDNPDRYQSHGLNKMIDQATGEVFLRADGHCIYQADYVGKSVETLLKTRSKNVGGAQRYVADTPVQAGVAIAVKSFLGSGGAKYMDENYEGYADTVFLGCFWTSDLKEVDGFNTDNITNQDSELNLRLYEYFGKSIYVSPEIKSWYYPRNSYSGLFRQYFRYGRGRFLTKTLHPKSSPARGLIPFLFICFLLGYGILDLIVEQALYFPTFALLLGVFFIAESFRVVLSLNQKFKDEIWQSDKKQPGIFSRWIHVVVSLVIMQVAHFSGFSFQLFRRLLSGKKGW